MSDQSDALRDTLRTLEAAYDRQQYRKIDFFEPYPKQEEFFALGATMRERLLMAANQVGKSEAGAVETAYHLTGEYPKGWKGRVFTKPVRAWAAGETSLVVRDVQQKKLCGEPGVLTEYGKGYIPKNRFADKPSLARGITDAYDTIQVEHRTNGVVDGVSVLRFKSYEQGRQKFQGESIDFIWFDEEPDAPIYSEGLTRTNATKGCAILTFTPLKGMSEVVRRFRAESSPDRATVVMTIDDAKHISPEQKKRIVASYAPHELEARTKGIPMLGKGRIFPYSDASIMEQPILDVPPHWFKIWGIDFGINHNFAAVLLLIDRDMDTIHVYHTIRIADQLPDRHSQGIKAIGAAVPVAWPQDGTQREKGTGETIASLYKKEGLLMLPDPAMWAEGGNSTERGVLEMQQRMTTGRLKVANHLADWFQEFREYHRNEKGEIVKMYDDLLSATRVAIMNQRFARQVQLGGAAPSRRRRQVEVTGVDFDLF